MLKGAPRGQSNYYQECQRSNILITVLSVYVWQYSEGITLIIILKLRWNYPSRDLQCLVALSIKDLKYKVERKRVLFKVSGKINILNTKETSSSYLSFQLFLPEKSNHFPLFCAELNPIILKIFLIMY